MSENYPINRQSEDALLELVDKANSEIAKWEQIKKIALGNLAYFGTVK